MQVYRYRSNNWNDGVKYLLCGLTYVCSNNVSSPFYRSELNPKHTSYPLRSELMVEEKSLLTFACLISLSNTPVHCAEEASSHSDSWDQSQGHPLLPSRCVHLRIKSLFVEVKMVGAQEHNFLVKPPKLPSDHHNLPGLCLTGQGSSCWSAPLSVRNYSPQRVATAKNLTPDLNQAPSYLRP